MADIVITEFMDAAAVARLKAEFDTHYDPALADNQEAIPPLLAEARALIVRNRTQARGQILEAPQLKIIGRLGVGLDNIDISTCAEKEISVCPATGANDASVAEYVIATALILARNAYTRSADVSAGAWPRQEMMGGEIGGRVLGLLGYGGIARETARRADALGMTVIAHDPFQAPGAPAREVSVEDLLAEADILSLHVPLNEGTRHVINAERLAMMKPSAFLINAARGGVVDEAALAAALKAGKIAGAALDVFEEEPLTQQAGAKFAGLNALLTPHIAGVTGESNARVSALIAEKVANALR